MTLSDGLTLVTLVVATISMLLSCIALWPQSRQMLSFVRDVVLWLVLVFVFVAVATLGWRHYRVQYQLRNQPQSRDAWGTLPAGTPSNYPEPSVQRATTDSLAWETPGR